MINVNVSYYILINMTHYFALSVIHGKKADAVILTARIVPNDLKRRYVHYVKVN